MSETRERSILLPFYLVADVSYSMEGAKLNALNSIVPGLEDSLVKNPILSDKIRFSIIDFSDDARVLLPLCDLAEQDSITPFRCRGGTSYAAAFTVLRQQLESDVALLLSDGYRVHRPAVFFLSDGEPTDDQTVWIGAFAQLTEYDRQTGQGFKWYPNVIPFGIGDARKETLARLVFPPGRSKLYMMADGSDAVDAIRSMAEVLISSVISSGYSAASGNSGIILPDRDDVPESINVYDEYWPT